MGPACGTSTGRRLSGSDVNQDHPVGGIIAPENAGVGIPLAAHSPISTDHHAIDTTEEPLLQEVWVNFWYVDPAKLTETTTMCIIIGELVGTKCVSRNSGIPFDPSNE